MPDLDQFLAACAPDDVVEITDYLGNTFTATVVQVAPPGAHLELREADTNHNTLWTFQGTEMALRVQGKSSF
jgi:hypothetical protein